MKYILQLKTGDAELRSLKNIPIEIYANNDLGLLVELTRGRKSKKDEVGDLQKRITALKSFLSPNTKIYFDVTSESSLSNSQIDDLFDISNGYENWQNLYGELYGYFPNSVPMIIVNDIDVDYSNFKSQALSFVQRYNRIGYKIYPSVGEETVKEELAILASLLEKYSTAEISIFYDQGYILDGLVKIAEEQATSYLGIASGLFSEFANMSYILTSTSFPDSVTSLSGNMEGDIKCAEIALYNSVMEAMNPLNIIYSDYGSITPKRNDDVAYYARGWTPRIDIPIANNERIYYYRMKKENRDYADVYVDVAKRCVVDVRFPHQLSCWGCQTVQNAAIGMKPGATPSFWISVRMNIFIYQQLKRLRILQ